MTQILYQSQLEGHLKTFRLSGMSKALGARLKQAESANLSYTEFLGLLLEDESNTRADNRRQRLYRSAKLPFEKGLEDFDFSFQPSINKREIIELATCQFIDAKKNILFTGQTGTGKTHLSVAIALAALEQGKTVLFTSVWEMINKLQQSRADMSYHKKIQAYLKPDLLILDELGYRSMAERTVEDFFEIISKRYEKGSIIVTTTLAREAAAGGLSVKVADLDMQQGTLVNWQRRRLEANHEPSVSVESFRSAGSALNIRDGYDLLVLDGPARASSATLEIAQSADLVVQPTGASLDDLEPAVLTFHELVKAGISREKLLFALCRMQTEAEVRDCRSYLTQARYSILEGFLPERPAYRAVQNVGFAVTEIRYLSLRKQAEALVQGIVDRIGGNG